MNDERRESERQEVKRKTRWIRNRDHIKGRRRRWDWLFDHGYGSFRYTEKRLERDSWEKRKRCRSDGKTQENHTSLRKTRQLLPHLKGGWRWQREIKRMLLKMKSVFLCFAYHVIFGMNQTSCCLQSTYWMERVSWETRYWPQWVGRSKSSPKRSEHLGHNTWFQSIPPAKWLRR